MADKPAFTAPDDKADDASDAEPDKLAKRSDEDQVGYVTRLAREARLTGDVRTQLAHEDALAALHADSAIPNPMRTSEGEARANRVAELVGDGMPEDKNDPAWTELVRLTGYPLEEIGAVQPSEEGVAIYHSAGNGQWYLYVGADDPTDTQGRRGLMLLTRPDRYHGPFPVYGEDPDAGGNRTGMITTGAPAAPRVTPRGPVV